MHILVVLPERSPATGGNWVSAHRLGQGFRFMGDQVAITTVDRVTARLLEQVDVVHGFHTYKGAWQMLSQLPENLPLVVSVTGTDLNLDLHNPVLLPRLLAVLQRANLVVAMHPGDALRLSRLVPAVKNKVRVIKPAPWLPPTTAGIDLRRRWGLQPADFIFLLPAGIRPVKRPWFALKPLERLWRRDQRLRLVILGPVLHEWSMQNLRRKLDGQPWAVYAGELGHQQMAEAYHCADVVLNTSASEGMSNALLEAMSVGRPVLAADNHGNRALVQDGKNGLLFANRRQLLHLAHQLMLSPVLRKQLSAGAIQTVNRHYNPRQELENWQQLYRQLAGDPDAAGKRIIP